MVSAQVKAQRWLVVGMLGMVAFLAALAALHVISLVKPPSAAAVQANQNAWILGQPRHISAYALGPGEPVFFAGVLFLGLGMIAFAASLYRLLPRVQNSTVSCWLLGSAGASMLLLDVFPTDPTPLPSTVFGALHDVAAIASLTLQCAAMVLLSQSGNRDPSWQQVVGSSPAWSAVATSLSIGWGFLDGILSPVNAAWEFGAVVQRAVAVFLVYWMLMVGWRVRWLVTQADSRAASVPS